MLWNFYFWVSVLVLFVGAVLYYTFYNYIFNKSGGGFVAHKIWCW